MSDFHIVVIFNDYYTPIVAFFTKQIQKQTCCNSTFWEVAFHTLPGVPYHVNFPMMHLILPTPSLSGQTDVTFPQLRLQAVKMPPIEGLIHTTQHRGRADKICAEAKGC